MKKNKKTKVSKYTMVVLCLIAALIIAYVIIYLCFKGNGILTAGINLEKHDWLSFLGTYLSFAGSLIVSIIAIFQSSHYTQANKEENNTKRTKDIQPIFSIEIVEIDSMLAGYAEVFSLYHQSSLPRHKNFTLKIENVGAYPVKNVIIFDKYLFQLMKCNDSHHLQVAYDDSPDYSHESKSLRQYRTVLVVQSRSQIFRQSKQIEEARVTPLLTKFVTNDGKDASECAAKALAVNCAVLP